MTKNGDDDEGPVDGGPSEFAGSSAPSSSFEPAPQEETERERQMHGLAVLSLFLHSTATVEEMMAMLLEQAPTVTGSNFVYPLMLERKRGLLRASILEGCMDARMEEAMNAFQEDLAALEFPLVDNVDLRNILDEGEVTVRDGFEVLMQGVLADEQWKAGEEKLRIRKLAMVPMVVESEPLGLVVFGFENDDIDIEALELLVGHLTLALRDLIMRDEATRYSDVDSVTWVHSRRYLMEALDKEIARAGRYGRGLSLVLVDIEDFNSFNETYGQSMGDRLLRSVAITLAETISPPELVARLKDDDFAIVLPETNRAAAVTITTRLLASLAQVSIFGGEDEETPPITTNVAIVSFPEDGQTPQALLDRANTDLEASRAERVQEQRGARRSTDPVARFAAERGA
jgi:diguanylate cyclase (GGDEF)-like protein